MVLYVDGREAARAGGGATPHALAGAVCMGGRGGGDGADAGGFDGDLALPQLVPAKVRNAARPPLMPPAALRRQ